MQPMEQPLRIALVVALAFWAVVTGPKVSAFQITLFPAAAVYDPDAKILHERLGVDGQDLHVEDFEDNELESWLKTDLEGGAGEGADQAPWVGRYTSSVANETRFGIALPGVRIFGIGVGDNDGGSERISVNGEPPINLQRLPGHAGDGVSRAYYVLVEAKSEDADISSIEFDHGFTLRFDHLIVLQKQVSRPPQEHLPRLVLDLVDGSRLVGEVSNDLVIASVGNGARDLRPADIYSIRFVEATNHVTIILKAGDKVAGEARFSELKLRTALGELSVPRAMIRQIKTSPRGKYQPTEKSRAGKAEAMFLADEPAFAGKRLREWLKVDGQPTRSLGGMDEMFRPISESADVKSVAQQKAEEAIQKIGAKGVPFLVELVARGGGDARDAVKGFQALGARAKPAVPELLSLLNEPDRMTRVYTLWALGAIGPAAEEAVPVLLDVLRCEPIATDGIPAAEALGNIGPASAKAVPIIIEKIRSRTCPWDLPLVVALGNIGSRDAVPVLAEVAQGQHVSRAVGATSLSEELRRHKAVDALERLGPSAGAAVPVLVRLLQAPETGGRTGRYFTERLIRALAAIGPEAMEAVPTLRGIADRQGPQGSASAAIVKILSKGKPQ